ncbi:hypothetical protein [Streptomyces sp. NPDC002564]|uniref:hypothetical protein n=1 Tax=Streptomyces sp. NPDC002564 TaxID=3364649 RepID=UPI0036AD3667
MRLRWGVLALVGAVLAGCGADGGGDDSLPGYARADGVPRVRSADDMPELPLERYEFSSRDHRRIEQAQKRLTQKCMRSYGFADFPLDPGSPPPMANSVSMTASAVSPYGMLDLDHVRRWGYGFDPESTREFVQRMRGTGRVPTAREDEVLRGSGATPGERVVADGRRVPVGGCSAEGTRGVMGDGAGTDRLREYVGERTRRIEKAVAADRRIRRAFGDWSRCVRDKGFGRYANPAEAFRDKAWTKGSRDGNTRRTKEELGTAVADVECNRELNTAGVWWTVGAEKQRADLRHHATRYAAVRKDLDRVRANARAALRGERVDDAG